MVTPDSTGREGSLTSPCRKYLSFVFVAILLAITILPMGAMAEEDYMTINFEDLNLLGAQTIKVFDDSGTLIQTLNTSSAISLYINQTDTGNFSGYYTFLIAPSATNLAPATMLDGFFNLISNYWIPLLIVLIIALAVFGRRR